MTHAQLTLGVSLRVDATFNTFVTGENATLLSALNALLSGTGERFVYLWGQEGVGRSHLLQACCHATQKTNSVLYLSLKDNAALSPEILEGLEYISLICLDDLHVVLGQAEWEEALLHFYNRARDQGVRLIVAADTLPSGTRCQLPDLRSRLAWGLVFQVKGLSDVQKIEALQIQAKHRGMCLSEEVSSYLLRHYPRDMTLLFQLLDQLDRASLAEQRRITIPFVKHVFSTSADLGSYEHE